MTDKEKKPTKPTEGHLATLNRQQRRARKKALAKIGLDSNLIQGKVIIGGKEY